MIRLNVFIQVSEENRSAALEIAEELVEKSLKDNGCIAYDIFESATPVSYTHLTLPTTERV